MIYTMLCVPVSSQPLLCGVSMSLPVSVIPRKSPSQFPACVVFFPSSPSSTLSILAYLPERAPFHEEVGGGEKLNLELRDFLWQSRKDQNLRTFLR